MKQLPCDSQKHDDTVGVYTAIYCLVHSLEITIIGLDLYASIKGESVQTAHGENVTLLMHLLNLVF